MRVLFFSFIIIVLLQGCFDEQTGYLRTCGDRIVNARGENVVLMGSGLGGWMLQEGYMLQTAGFAGTQHEIKNIIADLIGDEGMDLFYEAWLANYCTRQDIDSLAAWGFNSIRLPMHYNLFTLPIEEEPVKGQDTWLESGFVMVDSLLQWCAKNEMYLILDLHAAPGGQGKNADISDYDSDKPSLWESEENRRKTIALWQKIAERYAHEPWIGGFDLINEPNWDFENSDNENGCNCQKNVPLWALYKDIIDAIRKIDKNHIVFIEGNCWGNNYKGLPDVNEWDDNLVLSFHKYWNFNDQASIQNLVDMREELNVPVWVGETGENSNTWFANAIELLASNNIGWAWWPYKKIESPTGSVTAPKTEGYQTLLNYWRGVGDKPDHKQAVNWLMAQADMLKLENCTINYDVLDAMFRHPTGDRSPMPFKKHIVPGRVFAVDYDLGGNTQAWFDTDTANYRSSIKANIPWNKGKVYRNDGVDIAPCKDVISNSHCVGWTEPDEWLLYTINVEVSGLYNILIRYSAENDLGELLFHVNENYQTGVGFLPATGGVDIWNTFIINNVDLQAGKNTIKLTFKKGGLNINYMEFQSRI